MVFQKLKRVCCCQQVNEDHWLIAVAPAGGLQRAENTTKPRRSICGNKQKYMTQRKSKVALQLSQKNKKQVLFSWDIYFFFTNKTDSYIKKRNLCCLISKKFFFSFATAHKDIKTAENQWTDSALCFLLSKQKIFSAVQGNNVIFCFNGDSWKSTLSFSDFARQLNCWDLKSEFLQIHLE